MFFRKLANEVKGRTLTGDKRLSFEETLALLNKLIGQETEGRIRYDPDAQKPAQKPLTLDDIWVGDAYFFIKNQFAPDSEHYCDVRHQEYVGPKDDKHYLNLYYGRTAGKIGNDVFKMLPTKVAVLEFLVKGAQQSN